MSTAAKASVHVKPCKIAQSELHNSRDMDYIKSLNPAKVYIRTDLMHLNETYVAPGMEGVSLQQLYDEIKVMVKEKTGRAMQEKDVEFTDKRGKKRVRQGCSPIRESVVNLKPETTMDDLLRYAQKVNERWGIKAVQIHIHKDEGHYDSPGDAASWTPNLHAHIIWDWMDHSTGKSYKLNADDMSEMQDMVAETLAMERGKKKSDTGLDHLERNDFILQKQKEKERQLREEADKALEKKKAAETQAAAAEAEKAKAEQQTAAAHAEKAEAEEKAREAKEQLASVEEQTKAKEDAVAKLDERIANKTKKDNTLAAGLIQKTHQDKVLTTEIQSKRRSVRSLDREIENKSDILDGLDEEISEKEETKSGLDAAITTKTEEIDTLDAGIEDRNKTVGELDKQINSLLLARQNAQLSGDWKEKLLRSLALILYNSDEHLRACVKIIQDFACAKRAGRSGEYKACFWDEESYALKSYMAAFCNATQVTVLHVANFLTWLAGELGKFNDYEKGRAAREVNDVALGRYDWRIQKHIDRGGRGRGR